MGRVCELGDGRRMTANEVELRALMTASLNGEAAAHRALLDRLSRHLRAYYKNKLALIGRSATEAEDLVQDALMAIHTRRHTYDPGELLTPWVHAIARYKLIDHLRRTKASMTDVPIEDAEEVMAEDDHAGAESALDLNRLMAKLPEKMQRAIRYVKLDGLSVAEAAARSGMSESAVKVSVYRGLKAMAAAIAQEKMP
jgi:RNA polymerase sigma-70 factor, ECF subfamily